MSEGEEVSGASAGGTPSEESRPGAETRTEHPERVPAEERDALVTIAHGAVVTSGGLSLQRVLATVTEFVLARALGPVVYGVYALAWRFAQLLFRFVNFGTVQTLQRYVPAYEDDPGRRARVAGLAYATTAVVGTALAVALVATADRLNTLTVAHPLFPPTVAAVGAVVALTGIVRTHASLLRAVGSARGEVAFTRVLLPAVRLVTTLLAVGLGYSVVGVVGALAVGTATLAALGAPAVVSATGIRPTVRGARSELRAFYNHATPVALSSIGKVFQNRVDILLVGALLTATATGVYGVVLVYVSLAWIPLLAFNMLLPPVATELYAEDRVDTLDRVYTSITRLILTAVVPILVVQTVFGRELLGLFGPTYTAGYLPLVVYLAGVLAGSAVGATGWLLMMTDHQYVRMALDWLLAAGNVALTYLFISAFGLVGAALGTGLAIALQNGLQVLVLRHYEGLFAFDATFLKPLAAGLVMAGAMWLTRVAVGGVAALAAGVPVGVAAYLGTLVALGVTAQDRLVVRTLAARYRRSLGAALP